MRASHFTGQTGDMRISAGIKPSTEAEKHPANAQLQRKDGPFQQKRGGINDQLDTFLHAVVSVLEVRMIGKQRRRSASVDEQYRPFILKALLRDAVDKPGHRFAGIDRVEQNTFQLRQQLHSGHPIFVWRTVSSGQSSHPTV